MDYEKIGMMMKRLRTEQCMTQKNIAEKLGITEQAVSKWERGLGLPDIQLLFALAEIFGVGADVILRGDLEEKDDIGVNMKNLKYYICPTCGNVVTATGEATIACCGRTLAETVPVKAVEGQKMNVERIEDEWYITTDHPMTKENHISFTAFATGERLEVIRHYPEWNLSVRIPKHYHGKFMWYAKDVGLLYQLV